MDNQHKKIAGYRDLSQAEIDTMNRIKDLESQANLVVTALERAGHTEPDDAAARWARMAREHLETGFMYAVKAVARPTTGLGFWQEEDEG